MTSPARAPKERPMIFTGESVLGILTGMKTQTRRLVSAKTIALLGSKAGEMDSELEHCPHGIPGDRIWVRESIRRCKVPRYEQVSVFMADGQPTVADCWPWKTKVLSSIHCPRGLSRIDLEIIDVRVERLQDITEEDAKAEGAKENAACTARGAFACLWDAINGSHAPWTSNPWVWRIEFRRVKPT